MFIPAGETGVIKIEIFTSDDIDDAGLWNVDSNQVLLSTKLYAEFKSCKTQEDQKKFFSQLRQVSQQLI